MDFFRKSTAKKNADQKGNLTEGPIAKGLFTFMIPIFLGQLLQQLYNMADTIIVGKCLGVQALAAVGAGILLSSIRAIRIVVDGGELPRPGAVALAAAVVSIVIKEILYRYTVREGRRVESPSMVANAWHHRSDALSSLGTLAGIGCAYFLGDKWRIADPIAALVVAVFIFKIAFDLIRTGLDELLERSLPEDVEEEILRVVAANPEVREPHNLRTRRIGASIAVEVHVRVDGAMSVCRSHELTEDIERRLRARFGEGTMIAIHVEPLKAACRAE